METIIGANVSELTAEEKKNFGLSFGIKILGPISGLLTESHLGEGFIITKINGINLESMEQLENEMNKTEGAMIEGMYPDGTHDRYYTRGFQV